MREERLNEVLVQMLPHLNNEQSERLRDVLNSVFAGCDVVKQDFTTSASGDETNLKDLFIAAKRIEGCSEKTLAYYQKTIEVMLADVGKEVKQITTDDLRNYLTAYQQQNNLSKVTVDNVRRIISSFYSWLEDEDYIIKSPVRRIHKVKTASNIKETYSDEDLEKIIQKIVYQVLPLVDFGHQLIVGVHGNTM